MNFHWNLEFLIVVIILFTILLRYFMQMNILGFKIIQISEPYSKAVIVKKKRFVSNLYLY